MHPHVRLRRELSVVAFAALVFAVVVLGLVAVLLTGALRPVAHGSAQLETAPISKALLSPDPAVVVAPVALRSDPLADRAPTPFDVGLAGVSAALVALLLLLARRLVTLPWSGAPLGATGRLPSRRAPPLALA